MKRSLLLIAFGALSVVLWPLHLVALDPPLDLNQYAHTAWRVQDGFLKSGVRSISQTSDGYLWLGTEFGLVRFDGVRFVPWNPPQGERLPSTNIRSLLASRDGTLWIGTLEGLASWKDGALKEYADFARKNVTTLLEDSEGTVWAGTFSIPTARLCAIRNAVQCYGADGSFGQWVWSLYEDDEHRLWAGAETGLWRWKPGPPTRYALPHTIETPQSITQGAQHGGPIAIAEGLWQLNGSRMKEYPLATPPGRLTTPLNLLKDSHGGLWVGTLQDGILHVLQGKTSLFAQSQGLSGDRVLALFEDREGSFWAGTADGLDRFRPSAVFSISVKQGLSSGSVWSVLVARDQSVWLTTLDGLNRWNDGRVTIYRSAADENARLRAIPRPVSTGGSTGLEPAVTEKTDPGLPDNRVGSLFEDERGRIWVSTPRGIARFDGARFTHLKEVPPGWVNAISGDNLGGVWISYQDQGLVHWREGKSVETVPWSKLGGDVIASSVVAEPNGSGLWLGFFQGGLVYFKDGQVRERYGKTEGLGAGRVMGLLFDRAGTLWASTEGGLSELRHGHIATLTTFNGLPCNTVHWMMEAEDSFWLYTACGLLRIPRSDLDDWSADPKKIVRFTVLDSSDGVRSHALLTGYTPRVSKAADGRVWFAHFENVSVLDPHDLRTNRVPPPVHIEQIIADDKAYDATNGIRLPPRIHDLTIDYTALSLVVPEKVRFRVKLEGQDKNWRELVNVRHVEYTNLPPNRYTFRVLACNNSGVWNEEGTSLDFVIPPAWYQTNWFRAACVAAFLAMIWGIYELRVRQLGAQFNIRLEERINERTRIARDLHDTLLQSFQGLVFRFQAALNQLPNRPEKAREVLESALISADQAIGEGRSAIQKLRSSSQESSLEQMLLSMGRELASAQNSDESAPSLRVIVEGNPRAERATIREEIYRIARELLRNAYRHAQARNIEAELRYDAAAFLLIVRDDGKGIDSQVLKDRGRAGHWGLPGMYERAEGIGARLDIWSEAGAGTEVRLTVPAAIAYEKSGDSGKFNLFRKTRIYEHRS